MDITAEGVQRINTSSQILEQQITSILKTFKSEIIEASKNGETRVIIAVPSNFTIINMNNTTAQTIIYHRLIEELESKGFNVKMAMDNSVITYCIRWDIKTTDYDLKHMRDNIAGHVIKGKDPKK
jgi:hypothetical protein